MGWYDTGALRNYENIIPILICGVICLLTASYSQRKIKNIKIGLLVSVTFCYLIIATILVIIAFFSGTLKDIVPWTFLVIRMGIPILFPLIFMSWGAAYINQMRREKHNFEVRTVLDKIKKIIIPALLFFAATGILVWFGTQNSVVNAYYDGFKNWYVYNWTPYRIRIGSDAYLHTSFPIPYIPKEWLIEQTTYEFLENHYNQNNSRWNNIKKILEEHDELWLYRSPPETWKELAGVEGYALVRKGKAVSGFITSMN